MKSKWLRWAWMLPVGELMLAAVVAGVPAVRILRAEKHEGSHSGKTLAQIDPSIVIDAIARMDMMQPKSHGPYLPNRFEWISFANFPGMFPSVLVARFSKSWPDEWSPSWSEGLGMWAWRSISWPILCLPFWWFAGRGVDAFLDSLSHKGTRYVRWFEAWGILAIVTFLAVVQAGLAIASNPNDGMPEMRWMLLPASMWFAFGLMPLLAWIRQRRFFRPEAGMSARTQ